MSRLRKSFVIFCFIYLKLFFKKRFKNKIKIIGRSVIRTGGVDIVFIYIPERVNGLH